MRNRRTNHALAAAALALLLGACGNPGPATLTLSGDTLNPVKVVQYKGGASSAECGFAVTANVAGARRSSVKLTHGDIIYAYAQTGADMMTRKLDEAAITDMFDGKSSFKGGASVLSKRQGISVSQPVQPIRGIVRLYYTTTGGNNDTITAAPFIFTCR